MPLVVAAGVLIGGCSASHPLQVQIVPPSPSPSAAPSQSPPAELEALWCVVSGGILTVRFINNEPQTVYLYSFDVDIFDSQGDLLGAPQVDASTVSQAIALAIAPNNIRDITYTAAGPSAASCKVTGWTGGYSP